MLNKAKGSRQNIYSLFISINLRHPNKPKFIISLLIDIGNIYKQNTYIKIYLNIRYNLGISLLKKLVLQV